KYQPVRERLYCKGTLVNRSPLICGSGEDERTDMDFIRDAAGLPFLPGTTLAGIVRHGLERRLGQQDKHLVALVFGERDRPFQSAVSFHDAHLVEGPSGDGCRFSLRDGVKIDHETRSALDKAKYDFEVLEPGHRFAFCCEAVVRRSPSHGAGHDAVHRVMAGICELLEEGIALGAKTRRGFGQMRLEDTRSMVLNLADPGHVRRWIDFSWDDLNHREGLDVNGTVLGAESRVRVEAEFDISGSLIIRSYSVDPDAPDATHVTSAGQPVVPGTSWAGALRSAILGAGEALDRRGTFEGWLKRLFGDVDEEAARQLRRAGRRTRGTARASRVWIGETAVEGGKLLTCTRTKVDRFTGGVVEGALFDERPVYGGRLTLNLALDAPEPHETALVLLGLRELGEGIQPLGGEAGIGRGTLRLVSVSIGGERFPTMDEALSSGDYLRALYRAMQNGGAR
ncbi:MAG TPA: RAMP superfamily CRISPR-associated protein, partial [Deltaproteobacteria bacterium]|nr:RAMP superfamily CRISPR-associated protein [Deltaproteobacteria bacterium]